MKPVDRRYLVSMFAVSVILVLLVAGCMRVAEPVPQEPTNYVVNGSFESLDDEGLLRAWHYRTYDEESEINVVTDPVQHGNRAVELVTKGTRVGIFQNLNMDFDHDKVYRLSGYYRTKDVDPKRVAFRVVFNKDSEHMPLSQDFVDSIVSSSSSGCELAGPGTYFYCYAEEAAEDDWVPFSIEFSPPPGATFIQFWVKVRNGTTGKVWWDNVTLMEKVD